MGMESSVSPAQVDRMKALYFDRAPPTPEEIERMTSSILRATALAHGIRPSQEELGRLCGATKTWTCRLLNGQRSGASPKRYSNEGPVGVWEPAVPRPLGDFPSSARFDGAHCYRVGASQGSLPPRPMTVVEIGMWSVGGTEKNYAA